ncbi:hypothetical protein B0H11DRAFT_1196775 [Mycena galericulata]|nr:hypothetical protein B0H11DRAFT_1196775 [Mycena galericulata]
MMAVKEEQSRNWSHCELPIHIIYKCCVIPLDDRHSVILRSSAKMAESTESAKTAEILARDSVYFLSIVAAALQHGHRPLVGETGRNQGDIVAKIKIREGSALTHLSTCLTRGLAGLENSRIIAVAAGPLTSDGITLSVCTSPKESPESSPTISHSPSTDATSLDVADQASTGVLSRPNSPPQNTGTSIKRNSGTVEAGEVHTVTISASETSSATLFPPAAFWVSCGILNTGRRLYFLSCLVLGHDRKAHASIEKVLRLGRNQGLDAHN